MAKLLVYTKAAPAHANDANINAGQYQPGMVITIINDNEQFGASDIGPHSTVISVPGTDKANLSFLVSPDITETAQVIGGSNTIVDKLNSVRMWTASSLNSLKLASGTISVPKGQETTFANTYFAKTVSAAAPAVIG